MFEKAIAKMMDTHGLLEQELCSAYFDTFAGSKKTTLETTLQELGSLRLRLRQIQQALRDPLWVVLVGRFSAGKSSLINAFFGVCGQEAMRKTGLFPTDKQATAVLNESCRTGLLSGDSSVVQVEGLGLLVQEHKDDRLRPLLLVDTPGLLEDEAIDDALMEFIGHADVVLHCMSPDFTLGTCDNSLLEKRRKHFPSQIYNIVVTNGDVRFKDASGNFSEDLWQTYLSGLDARYGEETRENLDHSSNAKTRRAWVIDSLSGLHVENLLSFLLDLADDQENNIPRVRLPIARERLGHVCSMTSEKVITPILRCMEDSCTSIAEARQRLADEMERYQRNILAPTREVLLLGIQSLRSDAIPSSLDKQIASALGMTNIIEIEDDLSIFEGNPLWEATNTLWQAIGKWRNALLDFPAFQAIGKRRELHRANYNLCRTGLVKDAIPEYSNWFSGSRYGRRIEALLAFDSPLSLLNHNELMQETSLNKSKEALEKGDSNEDTIESLQKAAQFDLDSFEQGLVSAFSEGTRMVLSHAQTESPRSALSVLGAAVQAKLGKIAQRYEDKLEMLKAQEARPAEEQIDDTVSIIMGAVDNRVAQAVEAMRNSHEMTMASTRGLLMEKGLIFQLPIESASTWEEIESALRTSLAQVVASSLHSPMTKELETLVDQIQHDVSELKDNFDGREKDIANLFLLDIVNLENSKKSIDDKAGEYCKPMLASLEVFDSIKSRSNFFHARGIGEDLAKDLNNELGLLHGRLLGERRSLRAQVIGSSFGSVMLAVTHLGLVSGRIPIAGDLSTTIKNVILALVGVSVAALISSAWRLATFKKRRRADLEETVEAQLDKVCEASRANLEREEKETENAANLVDINISQIANRFTHEGLQMLGNSVVEQMKVQYNKLESRCELEQRMTARSILGKLQGYCASCKKHIMVTAENCAKGFQKGALAAMSERKKNVDLALDGLKSATQSMETQLKDADGRFSAIADGDIIST